MIICRECAYRKFYWARRDASRRGVEWQLTFDQWLKIWTGSGHWHERGLKKGQYVMGRYGDAGPYSIGNVKIITNLANTLEANVGREFSAEWRAKLSAARKGWKWTEEDKARIKASNIKTYSDPEVRKRVAALHTGWKHTEASRLKMSVSQVKRRLLEQPSVKGN